MKKKKIRENDKPSELEGKSSRDLREKFFAVREFEGEEGALWGVDNLPEV